jgi:hypothetical protein
MMPLMDLRGPVPNAGAHKLAWIVGLARDPEAAFERLRTRIGPTMVDRMLSGELLPGLAMGAELFDWAANEGPYRVTARDFRRRTGQLRWGAPPHGWRLPERLRKAA